MSKPSKPRSKQIVTNEKMVDLGMSVSVHLDGVDADETAQIIRGVNLKQRKERSRGIRKEKISGKFYSIIADISKQEVLPDDKRFQKSRSQTKVSA